MRPKLLRLANLNRSLARFEFHTTIAVVDVQHDVSARILPPPTANTNGTSFLTRSPALPTSVNDHGRLCRTRRVAWNFSRGKGLARIIEKHSLKISDKINWLCRSNLKK